MPAQISNKKGEKMNIKEALNALNNASKKISALKIELNEKAQNELTDLIDGDDILVDVRCRLYDRALSIVLYYVKQASTRDPRELEENCDWGNFIVSTAWGNLILSTPSRDAQKIDRLLKFCDTIHI